MSFDDRNPKQQSARTILDNALDEFRTTPIRAAGDIAPYAIGALGLLGAGVIALRSTWVGIWGFAIVVLCIMLSYLILRAAIEARRRGKRARLSLPRAVLGSLYLIVAGLIVVAGPVDPAAEVVVMDSKIEAVEKELSRRNESGDDSGTARESTAVDPRLEVQRLRDEIDRVRRKDMALRWLARCSGLWLVVSGLVALWMVESRVKLALAVAFAVAEVLEPERPEPE